MEKSGADRRRRLVAKKKRCPSSQSCSMHEEGRGERAKARSLIEACACAAVAESSGAFPRLPSAVAGSVG